MHVDIVTVNNDLSSFTAHFYDPVTNLFKATTPFPISGEHPTTAKIMSIAISKDKRELQSLYITYWPDYSTSDQTKLLVYQQFKPGFFRQFTKHPLNNQTLSPNIQPFFLDINGDMITDMMFVTEETIDQPSKIKIALGTDEVGEQFSLGDFDQFIIKNREDENCMDPTEGDLLSFPNSNAFIDLDGDCMPDIFLQKTKVVKNTFATYYRNYFEIYTQKIHKGKQKYCLIQKEAMLNDQS